MDWSELMKAAIFTRLIVVFVYCSCSHSVPPRYVRELDLFLQRVNQEVSTGALSQLIELEEEVRFVLESEPRDPRLYDALGLIYFHRGELFRASQLFKNAVAVDPSYARAFTNLGILALRRGDLSLAENYFHQAIQLQPAEYLALQGLELVARERGETALAERFRVRRALLTTKNIH